MNPVESARDPQALLAEDGEVRKVVVWIPAQPLSHRGRGVSPSESPRGPIPP
jgi:hypothetical protein